MSTQYSNIIYSNIIPLYNLIFATCNITHYKHLTSSQNKIICFSSGCMFVVMCCCCSVALVDWIVWYYLYIFPLLILAVSLFALFWIHPGYFIIILNSTINHYYYYYYYYYYHTQQSTTIATQSSMLLLLLLILVYLYLYFWRRKNYIILNLR